MSAPRLLRWLTLVALFLAPLGMIGASPAIGHGRVAEAGHCDDGGGAPAGTPAPVDCMIACAGLPVPATAAAHRARTSAGSEPPALAAHLSGLQPEAATPPPRSS
jgi:hypothetical protein